MSDDEQYQLDTNGKHIQHLRNKNEIEIKFIYGYCGKKYQNVDDLKIYTGPMKQPFKNIQIIGTVYLSARNEAVQADQVVVQVVNINNEVVEGDKVEQQMQIEKSKGSKKLSDKQSSMKIKSQQEDYLISNQIRTIVSNLRQQSNQ